MGNCQAAEAATAVIEHPKGRVDRIYWSLSVKQVMASNPGHFIAIVTALPSPKNGTSVKHLKLLRPDDTLHIGHVYRLVTFEEVMKELGGKKYTKLTRMIKMQKQEQEENGGDEPKTGPDGEGSNQFQQQDLAQVGVGVGGEEVCSAGSSSGIGSRHHRQWRPALYTISEIGT